MSHPLVTVAWVLSAMLHLQKPDAPGVTWGETYEKTATSIAFHSNARPLGPEAPLTTAAVLVALAYHESRFDPAAVGDGGKSFGLFQIQPPTAGVSKTTLMDVELSPPVAVNLLAFSFRACRTLKWEERMAQYAAGKTCESELAKAKSRTRLLLAKRLLREVPFTAPEDARLQAAP